MLLYLVKQISQLSTCLLILSQADKTKKVLWNLSNVLFTLLCPNIILLWQIWNVSFNLVSGMHICIIWFGWIRVFVVTQNTVMHHKQIGLKICLTVITPCTMPLISCICGALLSRINWITSFHDPFYDLMSCFLTHAMLCRGMSSKPGLSLAMFDGSPSISVA